MKISSEGEKRVIRTLLGPRGFYFKVQLPRNICLECRILPDLAPPREEDVAKIMVDLLRICTKAQEEVERRGLPQDEAAFLEHSLVQEAVEQEFLLLSRKSGGLNIRQLRIAAAMVRRVWTPLGALPDSVAMR